MTKITELSPNNTKKLSIVLLSIITFVGAFYRFYQLQIIPPGDGFDPAYYGLDAVRILNGEFPIYLATNYGREVLFSYLVAAVYLFTGPGAFGIHIASALVATLTIPATFLVTNEFFKQEEPGILSRWGGLVAALFIALSFWHLMWSRYSVRAILIPLFASLLCYFLLRAWRTQRLRDFTLTGLTMGLGFYTYQLAQLFPILVAVGIFFSLVARRSFKKKDIKNIAVLYGLALLVAAPLMMYAIQNPGVFNQRVAAVYILEDVNNFSDQVTVLRQEIWKVVKMYTISGDQDPLINIPGRPSFNPFLAIALLLGIAVAIYRWKKPHYLFLLSWFILMSAPAFLADSAAMSKRALGALPAAIILITLAVLLPLDWLWRRQQTTDSHRNWSMDAYALLLVCAIAITGFITYRDLFQIWGKDPGLYTHFNVGVAEIGEYIADLPEDETIYLSPTWIDHASLKLHANNREGIHAYNGRHCFVYPQETSNKTHFIIVPEDEANSMPLLQSYWPDGEITHEGYLNKAEPYYLAYVIPPQSIAQFQPQHPLYANWNNEIALLGYDISGDSFQAGDTITINLYMQALTDMSMNYTAYLHLLGTPHPETGNTLWGQVDREPCFQSYPTSWWQEGEIMRDTFNLKIADDAISGDYILAMGFYHWPELTQLQVLEETDAVVDGQVVLKNAIHIE